MPARRSRGIRFSLLVLGTFFACGPESSIDALGKNVRAVCAMNHSLCYEQGVEDESVDNCVELWATDGRRRAIDAGEECLQIYADFFACAADWTCEEFLAFPAEPDVPCHEERHHLNGECPGLSPYYEDQTQK
jgi:hypothetical protein